MLLEKNQEWNEPGFCKDALSVGCLIMASNVAEMGLLINYFKTVFMYRILPKK
jgi:hypothetical protein